LSKPDSPEQRSQSLVNPAHFDKAGHRAERRFCKVDDFGFGGRSEPPSGFDARTLQFRRMACGRPGRTNAGRPARRLTDSLGLSASAGPKALLCIAQEGLADTMKTSNPRGFPQAFLNHLETALP
jgi:hypothetical protein